MKLIIFSSAPIVCLNEKSFLYSPYEKEMQIWAKYCDEIQFCCPIWIDDRNLLVSEITFSILPVISISEFNIISVKQVFFSIIKIVKNLIVIFQAMRQANHIHLRCPGNIGLLACLIQVLFPNKKKTAKFAGNWDPQSKQPWSYRMQKWILSNTFLTHNMQVLVYGKWEDQSKNIVPFFTATYLESDKRLLMEKSLTQTIRFIFVGTLVKGKNPFYAIQLIESLFKKGYSVHLDLYGEGVERVFLECYILNSKLEKIIEIKGNQSGDFVKEGYQNSHFVILPSKSEGWPKAIAEGMFWGCVPIATKVSCVPFMLDYGNRGVLLEMDLEKDVNQIEEILGDENSFLAKSKLASDWSQKYTTDVFEAEIKNLLVKK